MSDTTLIPSGRRTVWDLLTHATVKHPDALFVREPGVADLRYADMVERVMDVARGLGALGIEPGDRVHIHLPNGVAFLVHWLAVAAVGAVSVPTNPESTSDELAYVLSHSGCVASVTNDAGRVAIDEARDLCPELRFVLGPDELTATGRPAVEPALPDRSATDPVSILYTSGSTGWPKGVVVTSASMAVAGEVVAAHLRLRPDDRWLVTLPLFHGNALFYSFMSTLLTGASMVIVDGLDPSAWIGQVREHDTTVASFFAVGIRRLLATPEGPFDRDHRMRAAYFGQNLDEAQLATFEQRFGFPLVQLYGMTETVAPVVANPLYGDRRNLTIGLPVLGYELRIVGESGRHAEVGEPGELQVRGIPGVTLMQGYYGAPELTAHVFEGGWLHTGDHVYADADGYISFLDRGADLLKPQVENISTGEIERVLREHPSVFDAAVVGKQGGDGEEIVVAFVVVGAGDDVTAAELVEFCGARLAPFKIPAEIRFLDELPRSPVGKVQKHLLRAQ